MDNFESIQCNFESLLNNFESLLAVEDVQVTAVTKIWDRTLRNFRLLTKKVSI